MIHQFNIKNDNNFRIQNNGKKKIFNQYKKFALNNTTALPQDVWSAIL